MSNLSATRKKAKHWAIHRGERKISLPKDGRGNFLRMTKYYGENVFDVFTDPAIPSNVRKELQETYEAGQPLGKELAGLIAKAVTEWALERGASHFCHWFQPLTGATAEKHDSFFSFDADGKPIEKLSGSQLMQGEPDASSFPHGGSRSTFEARGYTSWDMGSPMFLNYGPNGATLCIPTAFVSYYGDALDMKTPLLRSISCIDHAATKFMQILGHKKTKSVMVTCGAEQEYFLVDKAFFYTRPDLVMTGKTLFGQITAKNQQLEDHYFGTINERVLAFMQELDIELYKLGIPAKTRHNEVAPGQFEIAPIFEEANLASDHNQILMAQLKKIANKHEFVVLLHEKPFAGINGSGKHVNWSLQDNTGINLLEPGTDPHQNHRFLSFMAIVVEAVHRHSDMIRMSVAGHGNDHRLGANEAPPSIISVYLGDALTDIYSAILSGATFNPSDKKVIDIGVKQLVNLLRDNTDRNRTSPFAFTGNKFEFRAVGSSHAIGFPLSIVNAAVADVLIDANTFLESEIKKGKSVEEAQIELIRKYMKNAMNSVFNGDGYSQAWVDEAKKRGLSNLRKSPEAIEVLADESKISFLLKHQIYHAGELKTRMNVLMERYIKHREIEIRTLLSMVGHYVIPSALEYRKDLLKIMKNQSKLGLDSKIEKRLYAEMEEVLNPLFEESEKLKREIKDLHHSGSEIEIAHKIAEHFMPITEKVVKECNRVEDLIPDSLWSLPKYYDMLFLR